MQRIRHTGWFCLALSLCLAAGYLMLPVQAQTDWYLLKKAGENIGQIRIERYQRPNSTNQITDISHINRMSRDGEPFNISALSHFEEDLSNGQPLNFSYQYQLNNEPWVDATGQLQNNALNVKVAKQGSGTQLASVPTKHFLFPDGPSLQQVYREHFKDSPGSQFNFQTLHLGLSPQLVDTQVTLLGLDDSVETQTLPKGLQKFKVQNIQAPDNTVYEWRSADGKLYKAKTLGDSMEMVYATQRDIVIQLQKPVEMATQGVSISTYIPNPRQVKEASFLITPLKGQALQTPPTSDIQRIQRNGTTTQVLVKSRLQPPDNVLLPIHANLTVQTYLDDSPYLQNKDLELQSTANNIIGTEKDTYIALSKLHQWVYQNIRNKNYDVGFASAKQTLSSRSGDCTEHAVLLAGLARAVGIPSRVAVGLLYVPDTQPIGGRFVYHMWTEAWLGKGPDGTWLTLDATTPNTLADAMRIKLADSALHSEEELYTLFRHATDWMGHIQITMDETQKPGRSVINLSGHSQLDLTINDPSTPTTLDIKVNKAPLVRLSTLNGDELSATDALFQQGMTQLGKNQTTAAHHTFQELLQQTQEPLALYRLGEQLFSLKLPDLAWSAFQLAAQKESKLQGFASEWAPILNSPSPLNDFQTAIEQGDAALLKQDFASASNAYVTAKTLLLQHSPAWRLRWLQEVQSKQQLAQGGIAVKANPNSLAGWILLGEGFNAQDQAVESKKAFQNGLKLQATNPQAQIGLFRLALQQNDWDSLTHTQPFLESLKGSHAEAARLLGIYQMRRRNYTSAQSNLSLAQQLAPQNASVYLAMAELYERMSLFEQSIGKIPQTTLWLTKAEKALRHGLTAGIQDSNIQTKLGKVLLEQGKVAEAGAIAQQVLAENPLNPDAFLLLGKAELHQNHLAAAKEALQNVQILSPNHAESLLQLGYVAQEQGKEAEAINFYRKAHQLDASHTEAITALLNSNAVGLKSALKMPLNADERDYMVQLLLVLRDVMRNSRHALEQHQQLITQYGSPDFTVGFLQLMEVAHPLIRQTLQQESLIYQRLSAMQPPQRFSGLHYQTQLAIQADMSAYESLNNDFMGFFSANELKDIEAAQKQQLAAAQQINKEWADSLNAIASAVPKSVWDGIAIEGQQDEYTALAAEVSALHQALLKAKGEQAQTISPQGSKTSASIP